MSTETRNTRMVSRKILSDVIPSEMVKKCYYWVHQFIPNKQDTDEDRHEFHNASRNLICPFYLN